MGLSQTNSVQAREPDVLIHRRLWREAFAHRRSLLVVGGLGLGAGLMGIAQAGVFSQIVSRAFLGHQDVSQLTFGLAALLALVLSRVLLTWGSDAAAVNLAIAVKDQFRQRLIGHLFELGPAYLRQERTGELTHTLTEGIESLDGYYSQYLPRLILAVAVPLAILGVVFCIDALSGLVLLLTGPLIPFFMVLIGNSAANLSQRQWTALSRMSAYFLDVIQGLTTLKTLGRSQEQAATVAQVSERFRQVTMRVLRVTFLSALALEWLSTLSAAVVAVQIGLRLLYSQVGFAEAFFIVILAPEYYAPLRALGQHFHAATAGKTAAARLFAILETPKTSASLDRLQHAATDPEDSSAAAQVIPFRLGGDIAFEQVSYRYSQDRWALCDISLRLPAGRITVLVGPSGAGKSTLAGLLLGLWSPSQGIIRIGDTILSDANAPMWRSRVAWVPQNPYLFNGTVLENLRLANPDASLEAIQEAARLAGANDFFCSLPRGYDTLLGERGARLSAGQAQRLALARAFLKDASLVILDEPTAYLDPVLERQINQAINRLAEGRTVLMIAHHLSTVMKADQVIMLSEGHSVQAGHPQVLSSLPGPFQNLLRAAVQASGSLSTPVIQAPLLTDPPQPEPKGYGLYRPDILARGHLPAVRSPRQQRKNERVAPNVTAFLLSLMKPYARSIFFSILLGFGAIVSGAGMLGTAAYIIALAALHHSIAELQVAIVGVRFLGLARGLLRYWERLTSHQATFLILARLRTVFYQALEPLAPARLLYRRGGDLLSQIVSDINSLEEFYVRAFAPFPIAALAILATGLFLGGVAVPMAVVLTLLLLVAGGALPWLAFRLGQVDGRRWVWHRTRLAAQITDCLQGMPDLLIFDRAAIYRKRLFLASGQFNRLQRRIGLRNAGLYALSSGVAYLGFWAVLVLVIHATGQGQASGVWIGPVALVALASFEAVLPLPGAAQRFSAHHAASQRLLAVVNQPPTLASVEPVLKPPQDHILQFENVSFAYPFERGAGEPTMFTLEKLNFSLKPGERLAVVGPSGAGKTTLVNLLLRFWDCSKGRIMIGGINIKHFDAQALRRMVAVLPQNPYLFSASVRENLRLAKPDASEPELLAACRQAEIADLIQSLPQGLDTWLGEGGRGMSAGERQRLALARALLRNAPLLVLDEPMSHLDILTENALRAIFSQPRPGQALLVITHRLANLVDFDEILVLDNGSMIERGTFMDLIHQNGMFRRMWLHEQDACFGGPGEG